ncbi:ThuA domain-containing protein [Paenibacillus sp. CC-CFT747]|nr:ThuA domain-containing protein [Paenibacillus sp. CC-CFT747]
MLVIHNGISLQAHESLYKLLGARFTGHPPYQALSFQVRESDHPLLQGISSFILEEEPYQYEVHPETERDVVLTYEAQGQVWPAAWVTRHGAGRLVYVMPGHHAPTFLHPEVRRLLRNAADWLCGSGGRA